MAMNVSALHPRSRRIVLRGCITLAAGLLAAGVLAPAVPARDAPSSSPSDPGEDPISLQRVIASPPCPRSAQLSKQDVFVCRCLALPRHSYVYGTDLYTDTSMICGAALHAGVITSKGGWVHVEKQAGAAKYTGTERNGVVSKSWGRWRGSFKVTAVPAHVAEAAMRARAQQATRPDPASRANPNPEAVEGKKSAAQGVDSGPEPPPVGVPANSSWAGLWTGGRWTHRGTVSVSMFVGRRSWVEIGRCRAELIALSLGDETAEFRLVPGSGRCSIAGTLRATIKTGARGRRVDQRTARIVVDTKGDRFDANVAKPINNAKEGYRFALSDDRFRFLWPGAEKSAAEAINAARHAGYRCFSDRSAEISRSNGEARFSFDLSGNLAKGYMFLLSCSGRCVGTSITLGSSMNNYVQYGNMYGTPAFFFESNTFFRRTYEIKWRMPVEYETGQILDVRNDIYVALLSKDPLDYGGKCRPPS